jgi:myo-inositol-1(or 4)-monophosphatase
VILWSTLNGFDQVKHDYSAELLAATKAARSAAAIIQERAGRLEPAAIRSKGTHDLVTDVDEAAQREILAVLQDAFPSYGVLAEEGDDHIADASESAGRWIVDPIDGTTNFTHGVAPYAVSIALEVRGELVVGVVLDVSRDELFTAQRGGGLFVDGRPAAVSSTSTLDSALITTGFPYRAFERIDAYLSALRNLMQSTRGLRRPGSASIDLAYVASGRFDAFFETHLSPWDVAAGIVLVREGGGLVTGFDDGIEPLTGVEILASNGRIHELMLEQLAPLRRTAR